MSHGGCCNCFICKIGKSLGLMEECKSGDSCCGGEKDCCKSSPKKTVKKSVKKVAKKSKSKAKKK